MIIYKFYFQFDDNLTSMVQLKSNLKEEETVLVAKCTAKWGKLVGL